LLRNAICFRMLRDQSPTPGTLTLTGPIPGSSDLERFSNDLRATRANTGALFGDGRSHASHSDHAALLAAIDRYRALFQFAPDPYLVTDERGTIEEANAAAGNLLGIECADLARKSLIAYLDSDARRVFYAQLASLRGGVGRIDKWVLTLESRDGRTVPVEATVSAGTGADGKAALCWLLRDTSVRSQSEESMHALNRSLNARVAQRTRELELALSGEQTARREAEAANRIKTELFARLSHEFRTPLHAVSGYLEILQQNIHGILTIDQRRDVERIHQAQEHLMTLVNMILDFAKLEGGPVELSMAEIPIEETLRATEALVEPQFAKKSITYTHHAGDPTLTVFADREKVQQIVLNLLANAMRFTPEGGAVDLDWRVEDDTVLLRVRDTGTGIPADKMEQIFEPFVQLRAPGTVASGGTGLGLAISRDLARAMGGDVTVRSVLGRGSAFTLLLPLRKHTTGTKLSAP
jgi:PAS domain S-box-containing protein